MQFNEIANAKVSEYLGQCNGFENAYRHKLSGLNYSEGVRFLAENCGCYWLIDTVLIRARHKKTEAKTGGFEVWKLTADKKGGAVLTCDDGNGKVVDREVIAFTDFPFGGTGVFKLYRENGVLYLPEEH